MEDGYRRKRAGIQLGNVHSHLELAQWCLRHGLLGPAATELADATAADPTHPMILVLRHRLKMAMEPPPSPNAQAKAISGPSNDELDRVGAQFASRHGRNVRSIGSAAVGQSLFDGGLPRAAIGDRPAIVPLADKQDGESADHATQSLFRAIVHGSCNAGEQPIADRSDQTAWNRETRDFQRALRSANTNGWSLGRMCWRSKEQQSRHRRRCSIRRCRPVPRIRRTNCRRRQRGHDRLTRPGMGKT